MKYKFDIQPDVIPEIVRADTCEDYVVTPELAKNGFWLTVGKAAIRIKDGDDGISIAVYAQGREDQEHIAETWVTHGELEEE